MLLAPPNGDRRQNIHWRQRGWQGYPTCCQSTWWCGHTHLGRPQINRNPHWITIYPEILWCHRTLQKIKQWSLTLLDRHRHFIAKPGLLHRVTCTHAWPCWEVFKIRAHQEKSLEYNSTNLLDHSHGYFYMFSDIQKDTLSGTIRKNCFAVWQFKTQLFSIAPTGRWGPVKRACRLLVIRMPIYTAPCLTFASFSLHFL